MWMIVGMDWIMLAMKKCEFWDELNKLQVSDFKKLEYINMMCN